MNTSHRWDRKWAELKDGVFRYADSDETPVTSIFIPIENIIRLVTKNDLIVMKTKNEKLQMKTELPTDVSSFIFTNLFGVACNMDLFLSEVCCPCFNENTRTGSNVFPRQS